MLSQPRRGKRDFTLEKLKASFEAGQVYRRSDLVHLSSNLDRHLALLVKQGVLKRLKQGMYLCPRQTSFGEALPEEASLVRSFLKDDHYVVYSLSSLNSLELGTTQLYNLRVVFNRKRTGKHTLGGRTYSFYKWREAPKELTPEFLVVELLNRLGQLAEDRDLLLERLKDKLPTFNSKKLKFALDHYGTYSAQLKFKKLQLEKEAPRG